MDSRIHDTPSEVNAKDGDVHITGPGGVVVSLTPDAAAETSDRLLDGAARAQGQRLDTKRRSDEIASRNRPSET
jgi:hypothetical protein